MGVLLFMYETSQLILLESGKLYCGFGKYSNCLNFTGKERVIFSSAVLHHGEALQFSWSRLPATVLCD